MLNEENVLSVTTEAGDKFRQSWEKLKTKINRKKYLKMTTNSDLPEKKLHRIHSNLSILPPEFHLCMEEIVHFHQTNSVFGDFEIFSLIAIAICALLLIDS